MTDRTTPPIEHRAAVLVDYQNLHHYLKNHASSGPSPSDLAVELVGALRDRLANEGIRLSTGFAYADFGGLDEHVRHVQRALYLHGIQPHYVPSTIHRNTTDLQLAIDAVSLCHREPSLSTFVIVSGDRDYVPVVQALQAAGKNVVVVAFRDHLSTHLLQYTRAGQYIDAGGLLSSDARAVLTAGPGASSAAVSEDPGHFNEATNLPTPLHYEALAVLERNFGRYDEVYLTPLLRKLSEEIGTQGEHDPKSLVADLEDAGAVRLERRKGMPYDYTVLLVNGRHPAVIEARADAGTSRPAAADSADLEFGDEDFSYDDNYDFGDAPEDETTEDASAV